MNYEVRCCDTSLIGHIEVLLSSNRKFMVFALRPDGIETVQLDLAEVVVEGRRYMAFKTNHVPIETLRRIRQFTEYGGRRYQCNNGDCNWIGPLKDTCMLGTIGPLCPMCRETTQEQ